MWLMEEWGTEMLRNLLSVTQQSGSHQFGGIMENSVCFVLSQE